MPDEGTDITVRPKLLKYARELVPKLRERSRAAEEARQIPEQTVSDLVTTGLSRVCQPSRFGGSEQPWDVLCEVSMELGRVVAPKLGFLMFLLNIVACWHSFPNRHSRMYGALILKL